MKINFLSFKAENSSVQKSKEENHDQSEDQDESHSQELGLHDQGGSESDFPENLEYTPTESALDLKEDVSQPQKKKLPENVDFLAPNVSSIVDSDQKESVTETENKQEQLTIDSHPQLNRSSEHGEDLSDQENHQQDPNIPNGEGEGEEGPGAVGTHSDNQAREREFPPEHSNSKQEEDSTQAGILEEFNRPTQVSKTQKDDFEQVHQEQEQDNSNEDVEEETISKINKHNQDTEWQSQEGKVGLEAISNTEEMEKKIVSEDLFSEPTDDGDDGPRHSASEDYFIPSKAFHEAERATSNYYHIKHEEQRERAHENENVGTSEPGEPKWVRLFMAMFVDKAVGFIKKQPSTFSALSQSPVLFSISTLLNILQLFIFLFTSVIRLKVLVLLVFP